MAEYARYYSYCKSLQETVQIPQEDTNIVERIIKVAIGKNLLNYLFAVHSKNLADSSIEKICKIGLNSFVS
jgi:hypothetical protein